MKTDSEPRQTARLLVLPSATNLMSGAPPGWSAQREAGTTYRDYATRRIREVFARELGPAPIPNPLSPAERDEVLRVCNEVANTFGRTVQDERWDAYSGVVLHGESARRMRNRTAFLGAIVLNDVLFLWEDLPIIQHNYDLMLPALERICHRYFADPEDAMTAYYAGKAFLTHESQARADPATWAAIYGSSLDHYIRARAINGGVRVWMSFSYQMFDNPRFTVHARSGFAADLVTRGLFLVNDLYSYARANAPTNMFHLCDMDDPADFQPFFEARLAEVTSDIRCIALLDEATRHILGDLLWGNFLWTITCVRYDGAVNGPG